MAFNVTNKFLYEPKKVMKCYFIKISIYKDLIIMGFAQAVRIGLRNFFSPYGRASRSEFWWYYLFTIILTGFFGVTGGFVSGAHGNEQVVLGIIFDVVGAVFGVSLLCAQIRRLHDIGKSGWNVCWNIIPFFGGIYVLYLLCKRSVPGPNIYGPQP